MNQHELMVEVLRAAGGEDASSAVPADYKGRIADILFPVEDVIVEVKSLTTDRAAERQTSDAIGEMFSRGIHLGAPVIFGQVTIGLHDLPPPVAANALRIAGRRVLLEAKAANSQIKATKEILGRPESLGVVALITPPFKLDRDSIGWLMGDAMRDGRCSGIDQLLLVETPLLAPEGARPQDDTFISLHSRADRGLPPHLVEAIDRAWGLVTRQPRGSTGPDRF